jgi:hypothetical protein
MLRCWLHYLEIFFAKAYFLLSVRCVVVTSPALLMVRQIFRVLQGNLQQLLVGRARCEVKVPMDTVQFEMGHDAFQVRLREFCEELPKSIPD